MVLAKELIAQGFEAVQPAGNEDKMVTGSGMNAGQFKADSIRGSGN
jgi:hypothetical protein